MKTYARELRRAAAGASHRSTAHRDVRRAATTSSWREQVGAAAGDAPSAGRASCTSSRRSFPFVVPTRFVVTIHDLIDLRFPQLLQSQRSGRTTRTVVRSRARGARARDHRRRSDGRRSRDAFSASIRGEVRVIPLGVEEGFARCRRQPIRARAPVRALRRKPPAAQGPRDALRRVVASAANSVRRSLLTGADDFGGELQRRLRARPRAIVFLGDVRASGSLATIAGAPAYVQPALREGFGLPMLEAMRCGAPVIATDASVPRSVAGARAAVRTRAIRRALAALLAERSPSRPDGPGGAAGATRGAHADVGPDRTRDRRTSIARSSRLIDVALDARDHAAHVGRDARVRRRSLLEASAAGRTRHPRSQRVGRGPNSGARRAGSHAAAHRTAAAAR